VIHIARFPIELRGLRLAHEQYKRAQNDCGNRGHQCDQDRMRREIYGTHPNQGTVDHCEQARCGRATSWSAWGLGRP
jgi:hypothetical protein